MHYLIILFKNMETADPYLELSKNPIMAISMPIDSQKIGANQNIQFRRRGKRERRYISRGNVDSCIGFQRINQFYKKQFSSQFFKFTL